MADPLDILVVDDESELREQIRRLFEREGHRVMAVADGRSAIDRATHGALRHRTARRRPRRAGPDGYEVCRTLRERRNVVPIIMLTALDSEADAVLGLEAGADDYVTKPFGPAELRSRIRAVLRRAGPRALGDEVLLVGPIVLDREPREVTVDGRPVRADVLGVRAAARADGAARASCSTARSCCGRSGATARTATRAAIDVHIRHLREKLEPEPDKPRAASSRSAAPGYRLARALSELLGLRGRAGARAAGRQRDDARRGLAAAAVPAGPPAARRTRSPRSRHGRAPRAPG